MAVVFEKTKALTDVKLHYCPGCAHGIVHRLVAEVLEEMGEVENAIACVPVGCAVFANNYFNFDAIQCAHGRAPATATGIKRVHPDKIVMTYQGDGDLASIGTCEIVHAAARGEKITTVFINNGIYGMTGGQMSVTTMEGQKTSTSTHGRDCSITGFPMRFPELVASQFHIAYAARGTVSSPAHINQLKGYIKNAIEAQMNKEGYSVVEVLSPCPINWNLTPIKAMERIDNELISYFPLGEFKQRSVKEA